ncbi:MAG: hypothetical protein ABIF71_12145 [Planctomycetota bacterium]
MPCVKNPEAHYHIYLPTTYDPAKQYPVLFMFSTGKSLPIENFVAAAEAREWILVGAYECTTGDWEPILVYIDAIVAEFKSGRFAVHPKRLYAGGCKAAAKMATTMMFRNLDSFSGAIMITGWLGIEEKAAPGTSIYGIVGTGEPGTEGHLKYMDTELRTACRQFKIDYTMVIAPDVSNLPESHEHIQRAMEWLDLQFYKKSPKVQSSRQPSSRPVRSWMP